MLRRSTLITVLGVAGLGICLADDAKVEIQVQPERATTWVAKGDCLDMGTGAPIEGCGSCCAESTKSCEDALAKLSDLLESHCNSAQCANGEPYSDGTCDMRTILADGRSAHSVKSTPCCPWKVLVFVRFCDGTRLGTCGYGCNYKQAYCQAYCKLKKIKPIRCVRRIKIARRPCPKPCFLERLFRW